MFGEGTFQRFEAEDIAFADKIILQSEMIDIKDDKLRS
jgi:hypothetical protein